MKREGQLYIAIGLLAVALVFIQFNPFIQIKQPSLTQVKKIGEFRQLSVNLNCNVFLVQGDAQSIVYEGPSRIIKKIRIDIDHDRVTIHREKESWKGFLFGWLDKQQGKEVNIYVVVKDIHGIELDRNKNTRFTGNRFGNIYPLTVRTI